MGFSKQEYQSGLPPGDLPDPGIEPPSPGAPALQEGFLLLSHGGSPVVLLSQFKQISPWAHTYLFFFPFLVSSCFVYFHGKIIMFIGSIIQQWLVLMMCSGQLSSMFFSLYLLCLALPETSGFSPRVVHLCLPLKGFDNSCSHFASCRPHSR